MQNGKGSKPRSGFNADYRANFDVIDWKGRPGKHKACRHRWKRENDRLSRPFGSNSRTYLQEEQCCLCGRFRYIVL